MHLREEVSFGLTKSNPFPAGTPLVVCDQAETVAFLKAQHPMVAMGLLGKMAFTVVHITGDDHPRAIMTKSIVFDDEGSDLMLS